MTISLVITDKQADQLKQLLADFESGYITHPAAKAQIKRMKHQDTVREIVRQINDTVEGCKP